MSTDSPISDSQRLVSIVHDVVDLFQPLVSPYTSDIYWYLLRHSFFESGDCFVRSSAKQIAFGIGTKYAYKNEKSKTRASDKTISENLRLLEHMGAIKRVSDPNRGGTTYQVFLPRDIPKCNERSVSLALTEVEKEATPLSVDYYNTRHLRLQIYVRDGYRCYKCGKQLTQKTATLDHILAVSMGGENTLENLITCCLMCNSLRRNADVGEFLTEE